MKKMILKYSLLVGAAIFLMAVVIPVVANAKNAHAQDAQQTAIDHKEAAHAKLADAKLRACQNRQKAITNIMARIADRGQKQVDLFGTIANRTETFYTDKGKTLENYDVLVSDVAAKKVTAQNTVDAVTSASTTFDCSGDNPKGVVSSFKDSLKTEIEALKAYRTSVKNLIVGVKSVQSTNVPDNGGR